MPIDPAQREVRSEYIAAIEFPNPVILRVRDKVNVREKLALISDYWNPRIVGELKGSMSNS